MGFLKTDYTNAGDFAALPIGEYEVFISKVEMKQSSTGNSMIKVEMTVRDDVEQAGAKRKFFDNLVVMDSMMWKFNQVAKAVQLPEGQDIESPEAFAQAIQFKAVRIKNKHELHQGEQTDKVARYMESKYGGSAGGSVDGDPFAGNGGNVDISDDDLPF